MVAWAAVARSDAFTSLLPSKQKARAELEQQGGSSSSKPSSKGKNSKQNSKTSSTAPKTKAERDEERGHLQKNALEASREQHRRAKTRFVKRYLGSVFHKIRTIAQGVTEAEIS